MESGIKHKLEMYKCLDEYQGLRFKNVEFTAAQDNSTVDVATIDFVGTLPPPLKRKKPTNVS